MATTENELGVRLIVTYKLTKAALELVLTGVLLVWMARGLGPQLDRLAVLLREHLTSVLSLRLARLIMGLSRPHRLQWTAAGLGLDGVLSLVEGLALARRYRWAPWLVVIATSSLVPFELVALLRHRRAGRALLLLVNLAVVGYLARHARREAHAPS
jgi:uncharacterized membrane protein (DUF2068 family)